MNKVTPENIRLLLTRYLDGESTQEELRQLGEYLSHADRLPADLMPYAQMFALLDERSEVPTAAALNRFAEAPSTHTPRRLYLLLAAACIAAFAFILLAPLRLEEESMAVAYVDGKKLDDKQTAMQMGQEALQEIFSNGNQEEQLSNIFNGL